MAGRVTRWNAVALLGNRRSAVRLSALLLTAVVAAGMAIGAAGPASAAVNSITLTVVSDGSAPFDSLDPSATNGLVRTNDVLTYGWSYSSDHAAASTVTFVQTLTGPNSVRFDPSNVAQCNGGGGTISPDGHTLSCSVQVDASGSGLVPITVAIPSTVANGTAITSSLTANSGALDGGSRGVTVVAAPRLNLKANLFGAPTAASPGGVSGLGFTYGIVVTQPSGAKGTELVTAPLTFTVDLSAISPNASLIPGSCTPMNRGDYGLPFGRIGITPAATATNSVVDSGAITCTQSARTVTVTVTGADLSASSLPTVGANGGTLTTTESYLVSGTFVVFVPDTDVTAAGGTIKSTVQYRGFDPTSISGQSNYGSGYEPGGDPGTAACTYADVNTTRANDNCYSTTYGGRSASYDGAFFNNDVLYNRYDSHGVLIAKAGVAAGDATNTDAGNGVVSPGEAYWSRLQIGSNTGPTLTGAAVCDKWDPAVGRTTGAGTVYHNGAIATPGTDYTVQYAALPMTSDTDRRTTPCSVGTWYDTIAAAGGPATVNAVRFQPKWTIVNGEYDFFYVGYVAQNNPVGTILAAFDSGRLGATESWGPSYYVKETNSPTYTGDRLTLSDGRLRVAQSNNLGVGQFAAAGATYTYTLAPTVTDAAPTYNAVGGVVLIDTLPPCVQYVAGSASVPVQVTPGSAGADGIPCTGDTAETGATLRLLLGSVMPNTAIPPVTVQVIALRIAPDSTTSPNKVVISSDAAVPIDLAKRTTTANIVIRNQTQFAVSETTTTPQIQVGDTINYLIAYRNVTGSPIPTVKLVSELPYTGDANSSTFGGTAPFAGLSRQPAGATVECTSDPHGTISPDPASTVNTWTTTCDATTTALRITLTNVANTSTDALGITLAPAGNTSGDRYISRTSGTFTVSGSTTAIPATEDAEADVVASSITGMVWNDTDGNGIRGSGEPGLAGFPVDLSGTDDRSTIVTRSATTASDGTYRFVGLRAGTYTIKFLPAGLPAGKQFSPKGVGADRGIDSDGNPTTGVTASLVLAKGADHLNIDQGVRTAAPTVSLAASAPTIDFGSTVTLTATLNPSAATGTVTYTDAVVSGPLAGSSVTLGTATVSGGTAPLTVALPAFGANTITATYGGDGTYPSAVSSTVTVENSAAHTALLVTEFRLSGPAGATDQYVELTNTGTVTVPLAGVVVRTASGTAVTLAKTTPALMAGRSYLIAGASYSLGLTAAADLNVATLGSTTGGVRVSAPDTAATVTDAVGTVAGYSTGTPLPAFTGTPSAQYAWVRLAQSGHAQDTDNNAVDFLLVSTVGGTVGGVPAAIGSPSPSDVAGPAARPVDLRSTLLAPTVAQTKPPNRVYVAGTPGTLIIRRLITNTTGATVSTMRLRVTSLSEANGAPQPGVATQPVSPAQLRVIDPATTTSTVTVNGTPVTVQNLAPGIPSGSVPGGGLNTTLTVPLGPGGLANGASVAVAITFAVDRRGPFWFGYAVET
ncbi:MAG: SdrD B-like domain-containing protein [Frankia sp.]